MTWAPDYLTLAEAKAFLRVSDTVDDVEVALWITAASRAIDARCNRQFGNVAATARVYRRQPVYDPTLGLWTLTVDDFYSTTGGVVDGTAWASAGLVALPDNAPLDGRPYERIGYYVAPIPPSPGYPTPITVTMPWGWAAVPSQVAAAARLQVSRWAARRDSPYGVAGSPENGSEIRLLAKLDPDVSVMLARLTRPRRVG